MDQCWVRVRVRVEISVNSHLKNETSSRTETGLCVRLSSFISNPPIPSLLNMASNQANLIQTWSILSYGACCNLSSPPWKDPGLRHAYCQFNRFCLSARMSHRDAPNNLQSDQRTTCAPSPGVVCSDFLSFLRTSFSPFSILPPLLRLLPHCSSALKDQWHFVKIDWLL